jgi:hypothetical protein
MLQNRCFFFVNDYIKLSYSVWIVLRGRSGPTLVEILHYQHYPCLAQKYYSGLQRKFATNTLAYFANCQLQRKAVIITET